MNPEAGAPNWSAWLDNLGLALWRYDHRADRLTYSPLLMTWLGGDFPPPSGAGLADLRARIHSRAN